MPFLEFPPTTGPWAVGQCDVLWKEEEVNELGSPGGAGGGGSAADKKKLVVRIFYPSPKEPEGGKEPPRAAWLPQTYGAKSITYAEAYAKFMWRPGINSAVIGTLGFLPLMQNVRCQTLSDVPLASPPGGLKPLIYSHGMGGSRSCYSAVCADLASHGYFVVAPEHSDGSASINVLPDKTVVEHKFVPNKAVIKSQEKRIPGGFTRSLVPQFQPKPMTQYEFRNSQLLQRVQEMRFIVDCLCAIASSKTQEAYAEGSALELPPVLQKDIAGLLDMSRLSCVGHSFGAATCVQACVQDSRLKACVAHDAWLFPLSNSVASGGVPCPTLFINADTFDMLWEEGSRVLCSLLSKSPEAVAYRVNGTRHQNFADFPLLAPQITVSIGVSGSTDPKVALDVVHRCDASFLDHALYPEMRQGGGGSGGEGWQVPEDMCSHVAKFEPSEWGYGGNGGSGGDLTASGREGYTQPDITSV